MTQTETVVLAGGCFWCIEAVYQQVAGVESAEPGYAGGYVDEPTYEQVSSGETGHAEAVRVTFDPEQISLDAILEIFWVVHNPTTLNQQGADVGTQYRSAIYYQGDEQREAAEHSIAAAAEHWSDPIVTELKPLETFWPAEKYHHNYFQSHPEAAYCQIVINPKLDKLRESFANRLR